MDMIDPRSPARPPRGRSLARSPSASSSSILQGGAKSIRGGYSTHTHTHTYTQEPGHQNPKPTPQLKTEKVHLSKIVFSLWL
jgi:hypothetical protein